MLHTRAQDGCGRTSGWAKWVGQVGGPRLRHCVVSRWKGESCSLETGAGGRVVSGSMPPSLPASGGCRNSRLPQACQASGRKSWMDGCGHGARLAVSDRANGRVRLLVMGSVAFFARAHTLRDEVRGARRGVGWLMARSGAVTRGCFEGGVYVWLGPLRCNELKACNSGAHCFHPLLCWRLQWQP